MGYRAALRDHLAKYKRDHLGVRKDGLWRRKKQPYPHILPELEQDKNILETIHDDFWDWFRRPKLHRDFHHLNSSQAMGFNLFFPFLGAGPEPAAVLLKALGVTAESISSWEFERVPDAEEGTNFDLWLQLESGSQLFFELKLTESEFGTAKPNDRRRKKYDAVYRPRLEGRVASRWLETEEEFFKRYQLLRNLWHLHADRNDRLFLVFPRANRKLAEKADGFHHGLKSDWGQCVTPVGLESLHQRLLEQAKGDEFLEEHLASFSKKYFPSN